MLVKNAISSGSEHIHLATTYAEACAARSRMWESLLVCRSGKCAEQILLSGVVELIVGVMLRDEKAADVTNVVIDLGFAPYNGKRLCRNEAIEMLVASKRGAEGSGVVAKAVVGEMIRQVRKYDTVAQERESLWRLGGGAKGMKGRQSRQEVIRVMRGLLALRSSEVVREMQFVGGVGGGLLEKEVGLWGEFGSGGMTLVAKKMLAREWVKWAKDQAEHLDDTRFTGADGDEEDLFRVDAELRELLGRGGREGSTDKMDGGRMEAHRVAVEEAVVNSTMPAGGVGGGGPPVLKTAVSEPAAAAPQVAFAAAAAAAPQAAAAAAAAVVAPAAPAAPSRRLCTVKVGGPPEALSLQRLLNAIAMDVGCEDCDVTALSVRRGMMKGKGEASIVEMSVEERAARAIYDRARADAFMKGSVGDGLVLVSVEVQGLGRIDNAGNEVFGSIDDDMEFGGGAGGGGA
jgi:hypothetical protein